MSGGRGLSDEDRTVWETVTRKIKPLQSARRAPIAPATVAAARKPGAPKIGPTSSTNPAQSPSAPPLAPLTRREKQRVARGHDAIDARLDLHRYTQTEANGELLRFLRRASAQEKRLVLVITGKSGILRREVPRWLALPEFRGMVMSVELSAIRHGGEGALYVRVRRERR